MARFKVETGKKYRYQMDYWVEDPTGMNIGGGIAAYKGDSPEEAMENLKKDFMEQLGTKLGIQKEHIKCKITKTEERGPDLTPLSNEELLKRGAEVANKRMNFHKEN